MATPPSTSKPPKTMSSRLLTMKFMQRAAAASTPTTSTSTPSTEPSPKRQKLSTSNTASSPSSDLQAIRAAVAAEEAVRSAAIERQAAEAGETRWVLSFLDGESNGVGHGRLKIVNDGYAGIDSGRGVEDAYIEDGVEEERWREEKVVGRRSFGRFNRALEKTQSRTRRSSSPASSTTSSHTSQHSSRSSSVEAPTPSEESKAAARHLKKQRKAKQKEAKALATKRKSKEVKLNTLTSISGGGNLGKNTDMTCFKCGQKGHAKSECRHSYNGQREEKRDAIELGDGKVKKRKKSG
ncbi:MAG: hypothetical protein M1836_006466 [Candelina mexicana]|nr:MAG: hypothetical protein M1836_006466 [Candelina mexicana]